MLESLANTLESLRIGYVWKILALSALITIGIFAVLVGIVIYMLGFVDVDGGGWISSAIAWFGSGAAIFLSYFLFPVTLPLITYLFLDGLADAIEKHHYPDHIGDSPPFMKTLPADIKLIVVLIVLNILVLPLYLVPLVNVVVYYLLNGYLLGREFFELIALRHMDRKDARTTRRYHRGSVIFAGILIVLAATTPIVNLFAPVLATIFMIHVFHHKMATHNSQG